MKFQYTNIITFVWVTNIKSSRVFYTKVLGFDEGASSESWQELIVPGINVHLALNKWDGEGALPVNNFLTFGVNNLKKFKKKLISKNVEIIEESEFESASGKAKVFKFFDPDRNIVTAAEVQEG